MLKEKIMLTHDVLMLRFAKPENFDFIAGQFVQFEVPFEGKIYWRSYSICSTPDKDYLEFCTKLIWGGKATRMFDGAVVGEEFVINMPRGVFVCPKESAVNTVFVATGVGVAPIASMVEDLILKTNKQVALVFGVRNEEDIFWKDKFESLAEHYANFKFVLTLSQPSLEWTGKKGRVTELLSNFVGKEVNYFICGSVEMVKDVRALLIMAGVNTKSIHFEIY